jgi:hypothetical protein
MQVKIGHLMWFLRTADDLTDSMIYNPFTL